MDRGRRKRTTGWITGLVHDRQNVCIHFFPSQVGAVLVEVDGEDVREWSVNDVIERAQIAQKVYKQIEFDVLKDCENFP